MFIKSIHISARIISTLSVIFVLGPIGFFVWVLNGPHSLAPLAPYVEHELDSISPNFNVKFASSFIKWDNSQRSIVIEVDDLNIVNSAQKTVAAFPKVSFDFSVINLLRGKLLSSDITLVNPDLYINTYANKLYVNPQAENQSAPELTSVMLAVLKASHNQFPINSIKVKDAKLIINNGVNEFTWPIKSGYARLNGQNKILAEMTINFSGAETYLGADISDSPEGFLDTKLKFDKLPSNILYKIFPNFKLVKNLEVIANGDLQILESEKGDIEKINFDLKKVQGTAFFDEHIKNKLTIKSLKAEGSIIENLSVVSLTSLTANINDIPLTLKGLLKENEVNVNFTTGSLNVNDLDGYWPKELAQKTHAWVVENTSGGVIKKAEGTVNLKQEDFDNISKWKEKHIDGVLPDLHENALDVMVNVEGVNVRYVYESGDFGIITDSNFELNIHDYELKAVGNGNLSGNKFAINLQRYMQGGQEFDTKIHLNGELSVQNLADMKIATIPHTTGNIGLNIDIVKKGQLRSIKGVADLTKAAVAIPESGFNKDAGVDGVVEFSALESSPRSLDIDSFNLKGTGFLVSGNMKLENNEISALNFAQVKFGNNDFKAKYIDTKEHNILEVTGQKIDLSNFAFGKYAKHIGYNKKGLDAKINAKNLYMKNNEVITGFSFNAICTVQTCKTFNAHGNLTDNHQLSMNLKTVKNNSFLLVESDSAGTLVNALGISPNIRGGSLTVEATLTNNGSSNSASGLVVMRNFTAVRTPLLGKILTLASLKGIGDLLNSEGITFEKFEAPFTITDGVISVKDARSAGSSIGLTANGTIDTVNGQVALKGAIVPAYEINRAFAKIPLIGKLLIGKKNEGLFASIYSVEGTYNNISVSVNPLSILTPGFLRQVFDIGR
jgi:hypothetical protein